MLLLDGTANGPMEASHINYLWANSVFPSELGLMENQRTLNQFDWELLGYRLTYAFSDGTASEKFKADDYCLQNLFISPLTC